MATGRIGTTPVLQVRWSKAPTNGTTSLSGLDDNSVSLVYSVGYEAVYRNGVLLSRGNDYTATNGTTVTLIDATITGDIIEIFANQTVPLSDTFSQTVADGRFIKNTLTTTTGDIIYASAANTPARLGIGSTDQVLKVSGGIPAWSAPGGMTLISTTTLSGATTTINTAGGYNQLVLWVNSHYPTADASVTFRLNADSGNNYSFIRDTFTAPTTLASAAEIISNFGLSDNYKNTNTTNTLLFTINNPDSTTAFKPCNLWQRYLNSGNVQTSVNHRATYLSTSAITSIVLGATSTTWAGGTALLYGVK